MWWNIYLSKFRGVITPALWLGSTPLSIYSCGSWRSPGRDRVYSNASTCKASKGCWNNSSRVASQIEGRGMTRSQGWELHRIVGSASRSTWEESCLRWDYALRDSHYTRPTCVDCDLPHISVTKGIKVLIIFVAVLIHPYVASTLRVATHRMSVHDCFVSTLICLH